MEDKERRTHKRRTEDTEPCDNCKELADRVQRLEAKEEADMLLQKQALETLAEVMDEVKAIRAQNETQLEIMKAWNNAKGFVKSVQTIGGVMTWLAKVAAAIAAIWALVHYGGHE